MLTDFLAKVTGKANLKFDDVRQFPHPATTSSSSAPSA